MGAWIEIRTRRYYRLLKNVAPFMGAWIEILLNQHASSRRLVAPFMGAWIEIKAEEEKYNYTLIGRALHGRVD